MYKFKFISGLVIAGLLVTSCSMVDKLKEKISSKDKESTSKEETKNEETKEGNFNGGSGILQ